MKRICSICGNEYEDLSAGSGESQDSVFCCDICDIRKYDNACKTPLDGSEPEQPKIKKP